eukprot:4262752-Pleurochrysis_carterae.AAC.2
MSTSMDPSVHVARRVRRRNDLDVVRAFGCVCGETTTASARNGAIDEARSHAPLVQAALSGERQRVLRAVGRG